MAQSLHSAPDTIALGGHPAPEGDTPMAALARMLTPATALNDQRLEALANQLSALQPTMYPGDTPDDMHDRWTANGEPIVRDMLEIPAQGLSGLRAKAKAATWCAGGEAAFSQGPETPADLYTRTLHGIAADLIGLHSATIHPLAVVSSSPDTSSELLRAAGEFTTLSAHHAEAVGRLSTAAREAQALYPDMPELIRDWQHPGYAHHRPKLEELDANAAKVTWPKPKGSPRVEAFDRWTAQKAAIDSSFGIPGLKDAVNRAAEAEDQAANRVASLAPNTIREAAAKYAVLLASWGDRERDEITSAAAFFEFLADLERLAQLANQTVQEPPPVSR